MAVYSKTGGTGGGIYAEYFTAKLTVTEKSYNVANNTSDINWKLELVSGSFGKFSDYYGYFDVYINGEHVLNSEGYKSITSANTAITLGSGTLTGVQHNTDGKKTIACSATIDFSSGDYSPGDFNLSGNLKLTTIPRASSITATDANIESAMTININRASSDFTHTITYSFGNLSGTIATKTSNTNIGWTIPSSFYAQIPNAKTGTVTLTCQTYSGNTLIGSKTTTFTVTAAESRCRPEVSAILIDDNPTTVDLTGDYSKLIKYKSTAKITPTATAKNSATISSIKINNIIITGSYISFQNVQSETFEIIATDSRGYTNTKYILSPTIIQYVPLTLGAEFYRPSPTGSQIKVKYSGNYFNSTFGSESNTLTINWQYRLVGASSWTTGGTLTPTKSGNKYSSDVLLGANFNYRFAYEFKITVEDRLSSITLQATVKKGQPEYDFGVDSNGDNYFNVNGNIYREGIPLLDIVYPVGSIYISDSNINPSQEVGGTWELIDKEMSWFAKTLVDGINYDLNSTNCESATIVFERHGHSVWFRIDVKNKVTIQDTALEMLTIDYNSLGFDALTHNINNTTGFSDGGNAVVSGTLNYSTGVFSTTDFISKTGASSVTTGQDIYFYINQLVSTNNIDDSICDKFYWKRTA